MGGVAGTFQLLKEDFASIGPRHIAVEIGRGGADIAHRSSESACQDLFSALAFLPVTASNCQLLLFVTATPNPLEIIQEFFRLPVIASYFF